MRNKGVKDLTIVSNNCGVDDWGLGLLLENKQIKKMIASYVGENKLFEQQFLSGELEVELVPQGTLAERLRAGGAENSCLLYSYRSRNGSRKKVKNIKSLMAAHTLWKSGIVGDFAFVKAWKADHFGNLVYRKTARNFNPVVATAGKVTLVEVEELVGTGELDPDEIHTSGVYVQKVLVGNDYEKRIERLYNC